MNGGFSLSTNYAFDWTFLAPYRSLSDGLTFCHFECEADWYESDHKPEVRLVVDILNTTIVDLRVYNVNHVEDDNATEDSKSLGTVD